MLKNNRVPCRLNPSVAGAEAHQMKKNYLKERFLRNG
jgi:hypothetical protein